MDIQNLNFPIFTIESDELNEEIKSALELKEELKELSEEMNNKKDEMNSSGKRLNFYVNNIIDYDKKFNYKNHVIIFDNLNNLYIYSYKDIKKAGYELNKDSLQIENSLYSKKVSIKQIERCLDLITTHNDNFYDYEDIKDDYDFVIDEYNEIINDVKNIISNNKINNNFNKKIHELLMVKFKNNNWKFIYFDKQYKDEIIDLINEKENSY